MRTRNLVTGLLLIALAGCASGPGSQTSSGSRDVITAETIQELDVANVQQVVERLHPEWLRGRGGSSISGGSGQPVVYLDGTRQGGLEHLRRISTRNIREIRFINGRDASIRYGLGHGSGVISVETGS